MTSQLTAITNEVRARLPDLLALYLFDTHAADNEALSPGNIELAVLMDRNMDTVELSNLKQCLGNRFGREIVVVDLRSVGIVLQYRIITTGRRIWTRDAQAAIYESIILSEKSEFNMLRQDLLTGIEWKNSVYGR
ncbi:nucleotidyltransferase domain-containing protein [Nitrosomonas marina]|uniref:Polymerase beta nucleotidyltransferase domain-containing protein n=1 Tax=Nitrosomonas marina TaxID=917 RepID=A0A1H8FGD7_9PROT|nr:nucleotidyltransferase domain-containing protein [Nitrosomonas marina]SEN30584.1 hypothetical protein SAMN05216325_11320 [Nitrosomonas marina]